MVRDCLRHLWRVRRDGYAFVVTFECDWTSFIVAAVQTLLFMRSPRHVIVQFIMRERTTSFGSWLKYALMRMCFSSVHMCVCSSRSESDYYRQAFKWSDGKVGYVPLHTDPALLDRPSTETGPTVVSAGRTFRDYATLLRAAPGLNGSLTIVASPSSVPVALRSDTVTVRFDVPMDELIDLMASSQVVVLPLDERRISTGQTVLIHAMTMAKPVVVTRVAGTVDYVDHMVTGLLVPPGDPVALQHAVNLLLGDPDLRLKIGRAGRERVLERHLPRQYVRDVQELLRVR